jgi:hypothetical protein
MSQLRASYVGIESDSDTPNTDLADLKIAAGTYDFTAASADWSSPGSLVVAFDSPPVSITFAEDATARVVLAADTLFDATALNVTVDLTVTPVTR